MCVCEKRDRERETDRQKTERRGRIHVTTLTSVQTPVQCHTQPDTVYICKKKLTLCVCVFGVCMCVCEKETERERQTDRRQKGEEGYMSLPEPVFKPQFSAIPSQTQCISVKKTNPVCVVCVWCVYVHVCVVGVCGVCVCVCVCARV